MLINYIKQMNQQLIPQQQEKIQQLRNEKQLTQLRNKSLIDNGIKSQNDLINRIHQHHKQFHKYAKQHNIEINDDKTYIQSFDEWEQLQQSPKEQQDKLVQETIEAIN